MEYYPILLEGVIFVFLLSLFEFILFYVILAPENSVKIQDKVNKDIQKVFQPNLEKLSSDNLKYITLIANHNNGYRYYLSQLDTEMQKENKNRKLILVFIIIIFLLMVFILYLYGRFIIKSKFTFKTIIVSILITYVLIIIMQLHVVYGVIPKLAMTNDDEITNHVYQYILQ